LCKPLRGQDFFSSAATPLARREQRESRSDQTGRRVRAIWGTDVYGCERVTKRGPASRKGTFAKAAVAALLLSGCSPEVALPAVHDMPPPRTEAPLTPD